MFGSYTQDEFNGAMQTFVTGCDAIAREYREKHFPNAPPDRFYTQWLQKRVRVVRNDGAHCFVDFATGDVLKAAGWSTPAKHARGNIYDANNGLKLMGPYGPAYLR